MAAAETPAVAPAPQTSPTLEGMAERLIHYLGYYAGWPLPDSRAKGAVTYTLTGIREAGSERDAAVATILSRLAPPAAGVAALSRSPAAAHGVPAGVVGERVEAAQRVAEIVRDYIPFEDSHRHPALTDLRLLLPDIEAVAVLTPGAGGAVREDRTASRWIDQTRTHDTEAGVHGDCTRAAIASLFALPLDAVPDFAADDPVEFYESIEAYFLSLGFELYRVDRDMAFDALHLASGPAARGVWHTVVRRGTKVVHDPHPSRAGLLKVEFVVVPVPMDPSRLLPAQAYRERLQAIMDWVDLAHSASHEFADHGLGLLRGPVFDEARMALATTPAPQSLALASDEGRQKALQYLLNTADGLKAHRERHGRTRGDEMILTSACRAYLAATDALSASAPQSPVVGLAKTVLCEICQKPIPDEDIGADDEHGLIAHERCAASADENESPAVGLREVDRGDFVTINPAPHAAAAVAPTGKSGNLTIGHTTLRRDHDADREARNAALKEAATIADSLAGYMQPRDVSRAIRARLASADTGTGEVRWRHVKRGSEYVEVGRASVQASTNDGFIEQGDTVVIYRGEDGRLWVREESEFGDGRFVRITPTDQRATLDVHTQGVAP